MECLFFLTINTTSYIVKHNFFHMLVECGDVLIEARLLLFFGWCHLVNLKAFIVHWLEWISVHLHLLGNIWWRSNLISTNLTTSAYFIAPIFLILHCAIVCVILFIYFRCYPLEVTCSWTRVWSCHCRR